MLRLGPVNPGLRALIGAAAGAALGAAWGHHFPWTRWGDPGVWPRVIAWGAAGAGAGLVDALLARWVAGRRHPTLAPRVMWLLRAAGSGALVGVVRVLGGHQAVLELRHLGLVVGGTALLFAAAAAWGGSALAALRRGRCVPRARPESGPGPIDVAWTAAVSAAAPLAVLLLCVLLAAVTEADEAAVRGDLRDLLRYSPWSRTGTAIAGLAGTLWLGTWAALLARPGTWTRRTGLVPAEVGTVAGATLCAGPLWVVCAWLIVYD